MNNITGFENRQATTDTEVIFWGVKEVAQALECSIPTARTVMHRADFPLIMVGKNFKVSKAAFAKWAMEKRI